MYQRKKAFTLLSLILISALMVSSVFAQTTVEVGVSEDDFFKYDIKFLWNSTSPLDSVPAYLVEKNQTDSYQITIDAAVGTSLRLLTVWSYANGTQFGGVEIEEIGSANATGFIYIYAADLTSGNYLFPLEPDLPFIINSTGFKYYGNDVYRATNNIQVNRTDLSGKLYSYMDLYFDQSSGVLVEATLKEVYTNQPNQLYTTKVTLKESSLWEIPTTPTTSPSITDSPTTTTSPNQTTSPTNTQNGNTSNDQNQ
ncbi:MAG: hypothetical protein GX638_01450, partial [Crenarchaeota archaeon]|nr:hypothetical protein [Thermoproteota archaeon]